MLRQKPDAMVGLRYSAALDEIEGVLIQALEPRLNKQGARWQNTATEYIQTRPVVEEASLQSLAAQIEAVNVAISKLAAKRSKS
jgi:hypothetical protein